MTIYKNIRCKKNYKLIFIEHILTLIKVKQYLANEYILIHVAIISTGNIKKWISFAYLEEHI